jgi:KUP system potassium uptake protein
MNTETSKTLNLALTVGALGVVYGDIGTSPLYALRECFLTGSHLAATPDNVLGVLSLILWAIILLVAVKYIGFVMQANNHGEGGILSLLALALPNREKPGRTGSFLLGLGIIGAGLLYGDGIITPSLTVLSAVEGLNVATPMFEHYVAAITVIILIGLFVIQRHGTGKVGGAFGPVMAIWFITIAVLGVRGILLEPSVLKAVNPWYGCVFLATDPKLAFVVLGAVVLAVTGAEALYADMGHFGAKPIRQAWYGLVMPSLFLNYLGQGALILHTPEAKENPFFLLAPSWALYPLVGLATLAAIIASQALISGVFSLTMQAVQLGFLPRMLVTHTSAEQRGQIYVPHANWTLMISCIVLVLGFGSSSRLAAAYGIAVTLTMITTTILFYYAARLLWKWSEAKAGVFVVFFLIIELAFCSANLLKVAHGGWVPLVLGAVVFVLMSTWRSGRRLLREKLQASTLPLDAFLADLHTFKTARVSGTAVFMSGNPQGAPLALLHNLKHNKVLHERNVLLTIIIKEVAHVPQKERIQVDKLQEGFLRVTGIYGFMDRPLIPELLEQCAQFDLKFEMSKTTFFLSSESIIPGHKRGMMRWRKYLFSLMSRNSQRATAYFNLPPNRVVELGMQVEM